MEEQFTLRVPPSVAERIDFLLSENASSSEDKSLDLFFSGENMRSLVEKTERIFSPEKDKSNDLSSEEEAFSLKRKSIRSATEGGTRSVNCSMPTECNRNPHQNHIKSEMGSRLRDEDLSNSGGVFFVLRLNSDKRERETEAGEVIVGSSWAFQEKSTKRFGHFQDNEPNIGILTKKKWGSV
ncbi:unnamed protein product [Ilex paraguariensis]|uniref:Uncharacterized protein n=1 Tax=Ilex paraguariensis TaxID=185542 RepID=A0ABC8UGI8_9AQUA